MSKQTETFHSNKGFKLAIVFFIPILLFSKVEKWEDTCLLNQTWGKNLTNDERFAHENLLIK